MMKRFLAILAVIVLAALPASARLNVNQLTGFNVSGGDETVVFITSGATWNVPSDWNSSNNKIECIGGGGGGRAPDTATAAHSSPPIVTGKH